MYNKAPLFIYVEGNDLPEDARNTISKTNIPFTLLNNIEEILKIISLDNSYALIIVHSQSLYEKIENTICTIGCDISRFFVLSTLKTTHGVGFFNSLQPSSETLEQFLIRLIKNSLIDLTPIKNDLLTRLIREELEAMGILKKYTAFKFLVDLIRMALTTYKCEDVYTSNVFKTISIINLVSEDVVERDIRHMLTQCWRKSEKLQHITTHFQGNAFVPTAKNILSSIILYLRSIM